MEPVKKKQLYLLFNREKSLTHELLHKIPTGDTQSTNEDSFIPQCHQLTRLCLQILIIH